MPVINNFFRKYLNPVFIETGSFLGDGIENAIHAGFLEIYSIELSDKYFNECREKFKHVPKVTILKGDSGKILEELIMKINKPITFWLDGHYSGAETALGELSSPLMLELEMIKKHPIKTHTILIDDLRSWKKSEEYDFDVNDIINKLYEINPQYKLLYEDGYIPKDVMVAII